MLSWKRRRSCWRRERLSSDRSSLLHMLMLLSLAINSDWREKLRRKLKRSSQEGNKRSLRSRDLNQLIRRLKLQEICPSGWLPMIMRSTVIIAIVLLILDRSIYNIWLLLGILESYLVWVVLLALSRLWSITLTLTTPPSKASVLMDLILKELQLIRNFEENCWMIKIRNSFNSKGEVIHFSYRLYLFSSNWWTKLRPVSMKRISWSRRSRS